MLYSAMLSDDEDLAYLPKEHPKWLFLRQRYDELRAGPDQVIEDSYAKFSSHIQLGNAVGSKAFTEKDLYKKLFRIGQYGVYYIFSSKDKSLANCKYVNNPDIDVAR